MESMGMGASYNFYGSGQRLLPLCWTMYLAEGHFHYVGQCICLCRCINITEGCFHYVGQCIWLKAASIMLDNVSVYADA